MVKNSIRLVKLWFHNEKNIFELTSFFFFFPSNNSYTWNIWVFECTIHTKHGTFLDAFIFGVLTRLYSELNELLMTPWWMWLPCIAYWSCALCHVFLMYADDSNDVIVGFNRGRDSLRALTPSLFREKLYILIRGNEETLTRSNVIWIFFFYHLVPYFFSPPLLFLPLVSFFWRFLFLISIHFICLFFFFLRNIMFRLTRLMEYTLEVVIEEFCNF